MSGGGPPPIAGVHVRLDLCLGEGDVVDAHLVDAAGEVLAVDPVAADLEREGGLREDPVTARLATCVPFTYRRMVCPSQVRGQVRPGVQRQRRRCRRLAVRAPETCRPRPAGPRRTRRSPCR